MFSKEFRHVINPKLNKITEWKWNEGSEDIAIDNRMVNKPIPSVKDTYLLWASSVMTDSNFGYTHWEDWCSYNQPSWLSDTKFDFTINMSNIAILNTVLDHKAIIESYPSNKNVIDFRKLKDLGYFGFYLDNQTFMTYRIHSRWGFDFYSWDCESIVLWSNIPVLEVNKV